MEKDIGKAPGDAAKANRFMKGVARFIVHRGGAARSDQLMLNKPKDL
jgi:hypothetical protein